MKLRNIYISTLMLFCISYISANAKWQDFESPENRFSVTFFGEPVHTIDTNEIDGTAVYTNIWFNEVSDSTHPNSSYTLSSTFFPENIVTSDSSQETIDYAFIGAINEYSDTYEYKISITTPIEIDGYPGKEYKIKNIQEGYWISIRAYLVQNQFFMLFVRTEGDFAVNNVINQFFNSFELYNVKPGKYKLDKQEVPKSFTIDFPKPPKTEIRTLESGVGTINVQTNLCTLNDTSFNISTYAVVVSYYPENFQLSNGINSVNSLYNKVLTEYLNTVQGQIKTVSNSNINGMPSKEFTCYIINGTAEIQGQILYDSQKLYMLIIVANPNKDIIAERDKFFNSFKLIK